MMRMVVRGQPVLRRCAFLPRSHTCGRPATELALAHIPTRSRAFSVRPSSASSNVDESQSDDNPSPEGQELKKLVVAAAVPFVAFGIVDQSVFLWAGEAISKTLGGYMALSGSAAAASSQVVGGASGVLVGGVVTALALRGGLPLPRITEAQIRMGVTMQVATVGGVVGIIAGFLIGMCSLVFIDVKARDRAKRAKDLEAIMQTVIEDGRTVLHCDRGTLWAVDHEAGELWSAVAHGIDGILRIPNNSNSLAGWCANHKVFMNIPDVKKDSRWAGGKIKAGQFVPVSMLCAPVMSKKKGQEGKVIAVIQLLNKLDENRKEIPFGPQDDVVAQMLAAHVAVFIDHVGS